MATYKPDQQYREELEQALRLHPHDEHTLIQLGVLLWEPFHEAEKGVELLKRALEINPKSVDARFWLAECYLTDLCDFEKARVLLEEAIQIDPKRADCYLLLAGALQELRRPVDEYLPYSRQAAELAPEWPLPTINYIEDLITAGQYDEAKQLVEAALQRPFETVEPTNGVEESYEWGITGRSNHRCQGTLWRLLEAITEESKEGVKKKGGWLRWLKS